MQKEFLLFASYPLQLALGYAGFYYGLRWLFSTRPWHAASWQKTKFYIVITSCLLTAIIFWDGFFCSASNGGCGWLLIFGIIFGPTILGITGLIIYTLMASIPLARRMPLWLLALLTPLLAWLLMVIVVKLHHAIF